MYFNEFDPMAAEWLRELFPGSQVDGRSIADVKATDVLGSGRAHFFAGIGGWEYALRLAGIPDDFPIWTGSCPCQPFSLAGKGLGIYDARHLWPEFWRIIGECKPPVVFGGQVASRAGREWLTGVRSDLEALGYVVGAADLCAAGVGAPHIRQRLYWGAVRVAKLPGSRLEEWLRTRTDPQCQAIERGCVAGGLAHGSSHRWHEGHQDGRGSIPGCDRQAERHGSANNSHLDAWSGYDIIPFTDGKARRIESGTKPLADGLPKGMVYSGDPSVSANATSEARTVRLKGYGNAIVPQLAAKFVISFLGAIQDTTRGMSK